MTETSFLAISTLSFFSIKLQAKPSNACRRCYAAYIKLEMSKHIYSRPSTKGHISKNITFFIVVCVTCWQCQSLFLDSFFGGFRALFHVLTISQTILDIGD